MLSTLEVRLGQPLMLRDRRDLQPTALGRVREIALAPVAFATIDIDLSSAASLGERQELIGRALVAAARPDHEVVARLRISGAGSLAVRASLTQQLAEAACEEVDGVQIEAGRLVSAPERVAPGVVAELAALMREDCETPGFRDEALALIEDWRAAMPTEVAEAFDPADLDALIAEGLDAVVARLTVEGEPSWAEPSRVDPLRALPDHALDFGRSEAGRPDVAVLYGANEAGKSTAFMAWLDFLFGFQGASPYAFRFERRDLVVGAEIETPDGPQQLRRSAATTGSLTDANNHLVAEERMARWLHGLDREAYRTRFSLNDHILRGGGKEIAQAQGDLGQLLHAAPRASPVSRTRWRRSRAR